MAVVFTTSDLANAKAALASGATEVQIGDRLVKYRSQKDLLALISMITEQLDGTDTSTESPNVVNPTFSRGGSR